MIVIIDGYNLLRQVFHKVKGKLDAQRKHFIKQLGHYKSKKSDIKEIIVVFDGGHFRHATREIRSGITVIFSGQKSDADEWIINYTEKNKEKEILLVSKDRELVSKCANYGTDAIGGEEFYGIVQSSILEDIQQAPNGLTQDDIYKYEDVSNIYDLPQTDSKMLDLLMEQTTFDRLKKEEDYKENKKQQKHKLSKKEKKVFRKIKKL